MKLIRRTLSLLLSAALIAQMSFVLAFAAGGTGPTRFTFKTETSYTCVAGPNIITIPANISSPVTINDYKLTDRILITGNTGAATYADNVGTEITVDSKKLATVTGASSMTKEQVALTVTLLGTNLAELTATIDKNTLSVNLLADTSPTTIATAVAAPAGLTPTYQWYKTGTATPISGQTNAVLSLAPITANAGSYYCVVSTPAGTNPVVSAMTATTPTVVLTVVPPITITTQPTGGTVAKGATGTTLSVAASGGTGPYTYQWKTSTGATIAGEQNATGTGSNTATYTVPTTAAGDFYYFCTVSSGIATPVSTNVAKVTVTHCDATAALTTITVPSIASGKLNISADTAVTPTTNFSVDAGTCNTATHLGTPSVANHGYKVTWTLVQTSGGAAVPGVTIDANTGVMTITHANLSPTDVTATLTATVSGGTSAPSASASITFHKETVCTAVPQSVAITGAATINAETTPPTTNLYTATVTYNPTTCGVAGHTPNAHGAAVTWALTDSTGAAATMAGVSLNTATGEITITKANLPAMSNVIYLKATATKNTTAASAPFAVTITRSCKGVATKVDISNIASFSAGSATGDTTKSLPDAVTSTGCEAPGTTGHDHTALTWSIDGAPTWVKFDASSNTLRVTNNRVPTTGNTITIRATTKDGVVGTKSITISRYSSGGGSSDDTSSNETQWEEVYDRVLDADSGDVLTANLGSNTEMPGYLFNKLRGKNVALKLSVDNGYTWTVNGKTITKVPSYQIYIPLDVDSYSNTRMFKLAREYDVKAFQLRHEGSFFSDMKLTIPVSADYDNKTLYLYSYNEDTNKLTYRSSAKVNGDSDVTFTFKSSVGNYLLTSKALYGENATGGGGGAITPPPATSSKPASTSSVPPSTSSSAPSTSASSVPPSTSSAPSSVPAPDSKPESQPTDVKPEKEKSKFPILVPILIVAILGVIVAVVLIARGGSGKGGMTFDD